MFPILIYLKPFGLSTAYLSQPVNLLLLFLTFIEPRLTGLRIKSIIENLTLSLWGAIRTLRLSSYTAIFLVMSSLFAIYLLPALLILTLFTTIKITSLFLLLTSLRGMVMLNLRLPAGIGDISWCYSKLINLKEDFHFYISADNPRRSLDFVQLLPGVRSAEYDCSNYHRIVYNCLPHNITRERLTSLSSTAVQNFALNHYLEQGNRIEYFIPDIPTDFHYKINTSPADVAFSEQVIKNTESAIGIYTSSYINSSAWGGWLLYQWKTLICELSRNLPNTTFIFLGADYDAPLTDDLVKLINPIQHINLCGKTTIGEAIEVLRRLNYFISYPCGLAVLSNVVSTPVMMFYPNHLIKLMYSWPDPKSIEDLSYKGCVFPKPEEALLWLFENYKISHKINGG